MRGTVAVTDFDWYDFLRRRHLPEVNFWTPSDRRSFSAPEFSPFFFKLKAPHNAIAGFGYFARWATLPDWLAWECFGEGNGCATLDDLRARIGGIRRRIGYVERPSINNIGCILIVEPTFFPPEQWIPQPSDWHARTVTSKGYDVTVGEGRRLWEACLERTARPAATGPVASIVSVPTRRFGAPRLVTPRLGQGTFRVAVTDAYERACAVTGEHSLPVLEAAHIQSYSSEGPHDVRNGILLRADLHRLFDQGYVTVTPSHRLQISGRLREDYGNGRSYEPFRGHPVKLPSRDNEKPSAEYLRWHNERVFLG
jgi:putative restriction endonuclease